MHKLPVRVVRVVGTSRVTPHMARVSFASEDLAGLTARLAGWAPTSR